MLLAMWTVTVLATSFFIGRGIATLHNPLWIWLVIPYSVAMGFATYVVAGVAMPR